MLCVAKGQKSMINKNHPDVQKYREEFDALWKDLDYALKMIEKDKTKGFDGPKNKIYKQHALKVKKLQEKYSYLFTD